MRQRTKLSSQVNLIFMIVTLITGLVFIFVSEYSYNKIYQERHKEQINHYYTRILDMYKYDEISKIGNHEYQNEFNGYIIKLGDHYLIDTKEIFGVIPTNDEIKLSKELLTSVQARAKNELGVNLVSGEVFFKEQRISYSISVQNENDIILVFANERFITTMKGNTNVILIILYIGLIVVGELVITFWAKRTVSRINKLINEISILPQTNYEKEMEITGHDEIYELGFSIEKMRIEIQNNEKTKQEILQNISHDFKNPIAIIKSYAEAIADGISDPKEAELIVEQAAVLTQKIQKLLEFQKVQYLQDENHFETVLIRTVIENIVKLYQYNGRVNIITFLDESTFVGTKEAFHVAFLNIVENALRYAKTKIVIRLQNKRLTFFNDGPPIEKKFVEELFKPYEKGSKGQFGLGMSIVQISMNNFHLSLKVENITEGVIFTIEPAE